MRGDESSNLKKANTVLACKNLLQLVITNNDPLVFRVLERMMPQNQVSKINIKVVNTEKCKEIIKRHVEIIAM